MRWPWQKKPDLDALQWRVQEGMRALAEMEKLRAERGYASGLGAEALPVTQLLTEMFGPLQTR